MPDGRVQRSGTARREDPRDMAKAGLPEPSSPVDASSHPPERRLQPVPCSASESNVAGAPFGARATPSEGVQGDAWGAYVTLPPTTETNAGSPVGREPYGDGGLVVVAGATTGQGGRESRLHRRRGPGDWTPKTREVCEMQSAETVLGVLRERGRCGLPLNELYRQLFNVQLYLLAYGRIYANHDAMTPGSPGRPWTACPRRRSVASSMRCATSATDSARCGGCASPKEREDAPAGPADLVGQARRGGGPSAA